MRVAVLGAGSMGRLHAELLGEAEGVSDVLVADLDPDRAVAVAAAAGGRSTTAEDALAEADAVVIATPPEAHAAALRMAIDQGVPAFCEKPLTATLDESIDLVDATQATGAVIQVGFQRRFDPGFARIHDLAAAGGLGMLHLLRLAAHDPAGSVSPTTDASAGLEVAPLFRDSSIHDFDMARWLTGQEVIEVHADAEGGDDQAPAELRGLDTALVTMRLSSGTLAVLDATVLNPLGYDIRVELFGSRDAVAAGMGPRMPIHVVDHPSEVENRWTTYLDRFRDAYRAELAAFLALSQGEAPNLCSARDGLEAMRIAVAASRSYRDGRRVRLDEIPSLPE